NVPQVSDQECAEFYRDNQARFVGPALFEASHILLACSDDPDERRATNERAFDLLNELNDQPERFERLAQEASGCPNASSGGRLGQLSPGETVIEFEEALRELQPGE